MRSVKKVAIIMGSDSDLKIMKKAAFALKEFNIPFKIQIVSAHRTPESMMSFARTAVDKYSVIIAGAGGAAHLPGMVAALTQLPVIGVPVDIPKMKMSGFDALLSIAQMPKGIPVATVAIDNAYNAGLLAVRILALQSPRISAELKKFKKLQSNKVVDMNRKLKNK